MTSPEPNPRQFNLRTLLAEVAIEAVCCALLVRAWSARYNPLASVQALAAAALVGAMIGDGFVRCRPSGNPTRRRRTAVVLAVVFSLACSPVVIGMEWGRDHPWPPSDSLYIVFAILRCSVLGSLIGWAVVQLLETAAGHARPSIARHSRVSLAALLVALLAMLWWPVRPWYQNRLANGWLLHAIEMGTSEDVVTRVRDVQRVHGEADAVGTALFRALEDCDEHVRVRAIQALKLFGDAANCTRPATMPLLNDESAIVRSAAAELVKPQDKGP